VVFRLFILDSDSWFLNSAFLYLQTSLEYPASPKKLTAPRRVKKFVHQLPVEISVRVAQAVSTWGESYEVKDF
jgi:hypothetical protein